MPKKKDPPLSAEEQRKRFEALAREVGARDAPPSITKSVLGRIARPQHSKPVKKK